MSAVPKDFDYKKLSGQDREFLNEIRFDQNLAQSPVEKPRRCTDIICCLIFSATIGAMFAATFYGYAVGEPWKLLAPIDGDLNICGFTPGYEEYTKLYIGDINEAAQPSAVYSFFQYGVCVKSCPTTLEEQVQCKPTSEVDTCGPDAGEAYTTYELFSYCIPNYDSLPQATKDQWDYVTKSVAGSSYGEFFTDILTTKWVILLSVVVCVLVTFLYIFIMHYCAFWLSWISVGLIQVMLVAIGYFAWDYRRDQVEADAAFAEESMATYLSWITWLSWIFAGIYYIVIICSIQSLRVAVAVIQTASSFVADSKRLIFVPVLYFFVALIVSVMCMWGMVCVSSIGDITADSATTQTKDIVWTASTEYMFYFMCFGFLWLIAFVCAVNEFVVIVSAITWYYSDKEIPDSDGIPGDSDVTVGMWWSIRYHAGTLAAGSLIVAIVWLIRIVFEYIAKKMEGA